MKTQTGKAVLRVDDFGKKYWEVCNSCEEKSELNTAEPLKFSPDTFQEGTEIRIIEEVENV